MIVGRSRELEVFKAALSGSTETGRCLVLAGEPGIGKTILLGELRARAAALDWSVVWGRGTEFEREVPFGLVVDALDGRLGALEPEWIEDVGAERLAELGLVFPALAGRGGEPASGLQAERYRCHHAVRVLLERLAVERPLLVALDDVHWADQASLELLEHLLRRPPQGRVLLALAHRPRQAPRRLTEALATAVRTGAVTHLELLPLTEGEAVEMLGEDFDDYSRRALYRDSGGNPFYLSELARGMRARGGRPGLARPPAAQDGLVPPAVRMTIAEELARLSPPARALLDAAAIVGEPFAPELAGRVAEQDERDALQAVDELAGVDLVRPADQPRRFAFRHPIVRRAVYESTDERWRRAAHTRAAESLGERGAPISARAHHVERSAARGDEPAVALLTEAGHAAAPRAPAAAARWFSGALRVLPARSDPSRRLALLLPLAAALGGAGHFDESRKALTQALELMPPDQALMRARIIGFIAGLDHIVGRAEPGPRMLLEALRELPDERSPAAVTLLLELGVSHWFRNEWDEMVVWTSDARRAVRSVDDRGLRAEVASFCAMAEYNLGHTEAARQSTAEAELLLEELSDAELAPHVRALFVLGHAGYGIGRFDRAIGHLQRGLAIVRATGQNFWFVPLSIGLGVATLWRGRLAEAEDRADAAVEGSRVVGNRQSLAGALSLMCWVRTLRGNLDGAVESGQEAVELVREDPNVLFAFMAYCSLSAALFERGEGERARDLLLGGTGGEELPTVEPSFRPHWYELLAGAELQVGNIDAADEWVARAEARAARLGQPNRIAEAARGRAAVLLARGDYREAADQALGARHHFRDLRQPIDEARAQILAGRALHALDLREEAARALQEAFDKLDACQALGYRAQAARELHRLGRRPPGAIQLTPREREVARLVAEGLTNRQVATALSLSEKTIEAHLSRVFSKLAIRSRVDLADVMRE